MKRNKRLYAAVLALLVAVTLFFSPETCAQAQAGAAPVYMENPAAADRNGEFANVEMTGLSGNGQVTGLSSSALAGIRVNIPEATRGAYDVGNCGKLKGRIYVAVLFLDDDEGRWTDSLMEESYQNNVLPALDYMEDWASRWGVWVDFEVGCYTTDPNTGRQLRYNGRIGRNLEDGDKSNDILYQAAGALGFRNKEEMHEYMMEQSGLEQIAYVVMLHKGGRSYTRRYWYSSISGGDPYKMEYCMVFSGFEDDSYDTASYVVAHEMLHLFGSEDYYNPGSRRELAKKYYPDDLMFCGYTDLKNYVVGDFTAYCIGWTDRVPAVCSDPGWWQ